MNKNKIRKILIEQIAIDMLYNDMLNESRFGDVMRKIGRGAAITGAIGSGFLGQASGQNKQNDIPTDEQVNKDRIQEISPRSYVNYYYGKNGKELLNSANKARWKSWGTEYPYNKDYLYTVNIPGDPNLDSKIFIDRKISDKTSVHNHKQRGRSHYKQWGERSLAGPHINFDQESPIYTDPNSIHIFEPNEASRYATLSHEIGHAMNPVLWGGKDPNSIFTGLKGDDEGDKLLAQNIKGKRSQKIKPQITGSYFADPGEFVAALSSIKRTLSNHGINPNNVNYHNFQTIYDYMVKKGLYDPNTQKISQKKMFDKDNVPTNDYKYQYYQTNFSGIEDILKIYQQFKENYDANPTKENKQKLDEFNERFGVYPQIVQKQQSNNKVG